MALRIGIALVLGLVAVSIAMIADRRAKSGGRGSSPIATARNAPVQLVRSDFVRPEARWLVVVFSSSSCTGCAAMTKKVSVLESAAVATCEVEFTEHRELHRRYAIDAVPLVVVADEAGVVHRSFFGATSATDLWAALAELRGSALPQRPVTP